MHSSRRFVGALAAVGVVAAALVAGAAPVAASGSANLWPNGAAGSRANAEWRTGSYGGGLIMRRTLVKAFLNTGEVLLLGSSAVGQGASDILVYLPGQVTGPIGTETVPAPAAATFSCNTQRALVGAPPAQGMITSRAEELAGPDTIPVGGVAGAYVPCNYAAPAQGIYNVVFLGPSGFSANTDATVAADVALANANNFSAAQNTSVAAWDATVRSNLTSTANITGRVFTYYLALFTGGNGLPVYPSIYPVTRDGFQYRVDLRGMDPNGWLVYGNQLGFLDSDGVTPLYRDAVAAAAGSPGQLTNIQGGVSFALPSFPLFFERPAAASIAALGIPTVPVAPAITSFTFLGNVGGNTSLINSGGTFTYSATVAGVYEIVISRDGINFDPTLPANRALRGAKAGGVQTVTWDGKDNSGAFFPAGSFLATINLHGGEYHFPMIDVENDTAGGPSITLLNPPGGVCPPTLTGGCRSGFYDDRAYMTLNGTVVNAGNAVGSVLCGLNPPTTTFSNPLTGFDTATTLRAFGAAAGGNSNVPCTGSFGDAKGLDTWTYYPSNSSSAALVLVPAASDIAIAKTVSNATPAVGTNVTFTVTAHNRGPNDTTALQVTDLLPPGVTFVSASASQGTYTPGSGVWNIGVLANGATASLQITVKVTGTTAVRNTATRSSSSPVDPVAGNDSASALVTGSTIPGLPNNGVPPVLSLMPGVAGLVVVVLAGFAMNRRRRALR